MEFLKELFNTKAGIAAPIGLLLLIVSLVLSARQRKLATKPDDDPAKKSAGTIKILGGICGIGCIACMAITGIELPTIMARANGPTILNLAVVKDPSGLRFDLNFDPKRFEAGTKAEVEMGGHDTAFSQVWLKQSVGNADMSEGKTSITLPSWPGTEGYARLRKLTKDDEPLAIGHYEFFKVP